MAKGDHDWVTSEVVTAANMDDFVQLQVVGQYDTAAARDTALSARKREGMVTYQLDTNTLTVYSGAAWSTIGPVHGAWTPYTPTLTQSGAVTKTVTYASYCRMGRTIMGNVLLTCTGAGTSTNPVLIGLPITAAGVGAIGQGYIYDASAVAYYTGAVILNTVTTVGMYGNGGTSGVPALLGSTNSNLSAALASSDLVSVNFVYEASADA